MTKSYSPGMVGHRLAKVVWEIKDGRFSMSGNIGNDHWGQCIDTIAEHFPNDAKLQRMEQIWKRWHLNDMKAGCVHQRESDFLKDSERVVLRYRFTLDRETSLARRTTQRECERLLAAGETVALSPTELELARLPYDVTLDVFEGEDEPTAPAHYTLADGTFRGNPERKTLGWLSHSEHPDGLLGKPCDVCGYKYGTAWLKEELPADVVAEIESWG